jgi:hypothetical protein
MSYNTGEVGPTFTGQYVIHGLHCTVDEANKLLLESDYPEVKAIDVEHKYATWGRLPQEFDEPGITNGWWVVPEDSKYKHKKKMTFIVTEESKRIEAAIQQRWEERRERYKVELK